VRLPSVVLTIFFVGYSFFIRRFFLVFLFPVKSINSNCRGDVAVGKCTLL